MYRANAGGQSPEPGLSGSKARRTWQQSAPSPVVARVAQMQSTRSASMSSTSQRRRQHPTPQERDRAVFAAIQTRADNLGEEKAHHLAEADRCHAMACWHLAR